MTSLRASDDYPALLGRLQQLENENRKVNRLVALLLVVTAALIFMGQAGKNPRMLDVDSLVIRDASGNVRIELGTMDDHSPVLRMFGGGGLDIKTASVVLSSFQEGSSLGFLGKKGPVLLTNTKDPSLLLLNADGGTSIEPASVNTYDTNGQKFGAYLGRTETVNIKTGSTIKTSAGSLTLFGKDGKVVWQAP